MSHNHVRRQEKCCQIRPSSPVTAVNCGLIGSVVIIVILTNSQRKTIDAFYVPIDRTYKCNYNLPEPIHYVAGNGGIKNMYTRVHLDYSEDLLAHP